MAAIPTRYTNEIGNLIQGGRQALGPDFLRSALRKRALRTYFNQRRRGDVSARLFGLDPAQARAGAFQTEQAASGNLSNALNESELADQQGYQNYIRGLLSGQQGQEFQQAQAERERRASRGTFGGFLGSVAGSFLPGIGDRLFGRRSSPYGGGGSGRYGASSYNDDYFR